jgi:Fe2+ or Zn2+ uptake regulation protein
MIYEGLRERHPSLSLSTVYATMESFARSGLVRRIASAPGRLRIDGTPHDHDHAVCRTCGEVFDIDLSLIERPLAPEELPFGLKLEGLRVEYEVICPTCRGDEAPSDTPPSRRIGTESVDSKPEPSRTRSRVRRGA